MRSSMKCGATSLCGNYVGRSISRMTRHGLPAAKTPSGTSRVTTLPAPITAREPMRHARQDDRAAADPDVGADLDRLAELLLAAQLRVHRVHRRVDLHRRAEQREVADAHRGRRRAPRS